MADTPDVKSCAAAEATDSAQAPFFSLRYHFGMLLGVNDFETEQAYHRGKIRLHNMWLHRDGVVWGFDVRVDTPRGEIRVLPGLAVDALGRELHLEADACLNVAAWFNAHRDDPGFSFDESATAITFDAHVVIRFKACLSRQVPALSTPCENSSVATAYSRVLETVEILLRPGLAPARTLPYHRLRLLFGLDPPQEEGGVITPADQAVLDAPHNLESFRRLAALDEIDLTAPEGDEFPVVLADIAGITLDKTTDQLVLSAGAVNVAVRPSHVATSTIQELLCGQAGPAGGPVVIQNSVQIDETANQVSFRVSRELASASVVPARFSLTFFDDASGWNIAPVTAAAYDTATGTVTVDFTGPLGGQQVRFIALGSGPTPLLGANYVPLNNGRDFVHMQERS